MVQSSKRKRKRNNEATQQQAYLLPRGSEEVSPLPFEQQPTFIANPLAHPIVQETDRAHQQNTLGYHYQQQQQLHVHHPLAAFEVGANRGTNTAEEPSFVGTNHLGIPNQFLHCPPTTNDEGQVIPSPVSVSVTGNRNEAGNSFQHIQPHSSCVALIEQNILVSPMQASSKKRSPFWQAFHQFNTKHPKNREDRQHHAACNLCGKTVNMGRDNSTTTLSQHLRKCNRDLWAKLKDTVVVPTIPPRPALTADTTTKSKQKQASNTAVEKESSASVTAFAPSVEALKHYIEVAFWVRFKDPPEDEWAGLIMILHKELARKLSKDAIRGIFQRLSTKTTKKKQSLACKPEQQTLHAFSQPSSAFVPSSIPIVNGSVSSSLSSPCTSPVLLTSADDAPLPLSAPMPHPFPQLHDD